MAVERDGFLSMEEDKVREGVRQSASESIRRYTLIQNAHIFNQEALTKDLGIRRIHSTNIGSSTDILAGFDAHFDNGNQKLVVVNTTDAHIYNTTTKQFDAQSLSLANERPGIFMYNGYMLLFNGTQQKQLSAAGTWTAISGSPPAAKFGTVHASRALIGGISGSENTFWVSGINDHETWDASLAVVVDQTPGSGAMTNLARLGPFVIVQTRQSTHAYQLTTDNPRDWDNFDISPSVGAIHHRSWCTVDGTPKGEDDSYAFFWGDGGPYMLTQGGEGDPTLIGLADPIMRSTRGKAYQEFPALQVSQYAKVESCYVPEYGQVRFGLTEYGSSSNDIVLWIDVESAIEFAEGQEEYPFWGLRNNDGLGYFPCEALFSARVDEDGVPSTTGEVRCFGGRDGVIYEMDAPSTYEDNGEPIAFDVRKRGYDGSEDGVRAYVKSIINGRIRATQVGSSELYVDVVADGGNASDSATLDLDAGLITWDGSTWDGGKWNDGEFRTMRADVAVNGERFEVRLYDNGNIREAFQIDGWQLEGFLEDRR